MERLLKVLGIVWGIGSFVAAVAFFAGGEWQEWTKVKNFVKDVPPATEIAAHIRRPVPAPTTTGSLACQVVSQMSGTTRNAEVTITMTAELTRAGFQRMGGGCRIRQAIVGGEPPHNGIPIESIPTENGWRCRVGDPPNIQLTSAVEAHLVACRVQ